MGLPLKDTASGIFLTGAALDTDHCDDAIAGATVATLTDFSGGDGSEVAFALVNRIHDAVTAYNPSAELSEPAKKIKKGRVLGEYSQ